MTSCLFTKLSGTYNRLITCSAPARIRKGQGAEALNWALCVMSRKLGYTGGGSGTGEWKGMTIPRIGVWGDG